MRSRASRHGLLLAGLLFLMPALRAYAEAPAGAAATEPAPEASAPTVDASAATAPSVETESPAIADASGQEHETGTSEVEDPTDATAPAVERDSQAPSARELWDTYSPTVALVQYAVNVPPQEGGVRTAHQIGLVVSEDGLVLMPGHMQMLNSKPFAIRITIGETTYDGELLRRQGQLNVSYVRVKPESRGEDAEPFAYVTFDGGADLALGDTVWVFSLLPEQAYWERQLRHLRVSAILEDPSRVYVVDTRPNPGDNGGLVLNHAGRPVGVIGYELSTQQGGEIYTRHSIPLIFPAETLAASIAAPHETATEKTEEAWFGILVQPLRKDFAEYFGISDETGAIISNVVRNSPAEQAGLRRGDIIVEFEGEPVDVPNDLALLTFTRSIRDMPVGTTVHLRYLREGEEREAEVTVGPLPKTAAKAETFRQPAWGLQVRELTEDIVYLLNLPPDIQGVVVDGVEPGGPAQAAGLAPGDLLREINGETVTSLADYQDSTDQLASTHPQKVLLFMQRGTRTGFTSLEPDWTLPAREE